MRVYFVYIMANKRNGTIYTGMTNDIERRVYQHKHKLVPGFTSRYGLDRLVYYEENSDVRMTIVREKQIKGWTRKKKIDLIESMNPRWDDLSEGWY